MLLLHANGQGILSSMHPSADSAALSRLPAPNANRLVFAELVSRSLGLTIPSPPFPRRLSGGIRAQPLDGDDPDE